ncbi:MAG: serine protease, partial [Halobacteriovoraceae bacterium]|nr:serine protease [Halobacteriovoraceae bacterium]
TLKAIKIILISLFFISFNPESSLAYEKVIQGTKTDNQSFPWQLSLQSRFGSHFCGGVLISNDLILTAAHCVVGTDPKNIRIKGGSKTGELKRLKRLSRVQEIHIHPDFDPKKVIAHDIALIKLKRAINNSPLIKPIRLPKESHFPINVQDQFITLKGKVVITGWGKTSTGGRLPIPSEDLMVGELKPLGSSSVDLNSPSLRSYLNSTYDLGDNTLNYLQSNDSRTLILEGKTKGTSPCGGDSGGPITYFENNSPILLGLSSYVAGGDGPCLAIAGATDIQSYLSWIESFQ